MLSNISGGFSYSKNVDSDEINVKIYGTKNNINLILKFD